MSIDYNLHNVILWHRCIIRHFKNKSYNCIKSKYHIRGHEKYLETNLKKFKFPYEKLMKEFATPDQIKLFFITCCLHDVNDIFNIQEKLTLLKEAFNKKLIIFGNIYCLFDRDVSYLKKKYTSIKNSLIVRDGMSCALTSCYFKKEILTETILILDSVCGMLGVLNKVERDNLLWQKEYNKLLKYSSFLTNFDIENFKKILTDK